MEESTVEVTPKSNEYIALLTGTNEPAVLVTFQAVNYFLRTVLWYFRRANKILSIVSIF